jgi:hypothetical protein
MNWKEYFTYQPETGEIFWSETAMLKYGKQKNHLQRFVGKSAGYTRHRRNGRPSRIEVEVQGIVIGVHSIVWEMHNDPIPTGMIVDHIDRNPLNNLLSNLRLATIEQNNVNRSVQSNNKSGVRGVSWCKITNKWKAQISLNKRKIYIGVYETIDEAKIAYDSFIPQHWTDYLPYEKSSGEQMEMIPG